MRGQFRAGASDGNGAPAGGHRTSKILSPEDVVDVVPMQSWDYDLFELEAHQLKFAAHGMMHELGLFEEFGLDGKNPGRAHTQQQTVRQIYAVRCARGACGSA